MLSQAWQVVAQLLWENKTRVFVDVGMGTGLTLRTAMLMSCKCIGIGFNKAHAEVTRELLLDWLVQQITAGNRLFVGCDHTQRLAAVKPDRLCRYEQQGTNKRTTPENSEDSANKRTAMCLDDLTNDVMGVPVNEEPDKSHQLLEHQRPGKGHRLENQRHQ